MVIINFVKNIFKKGSVRWGLLILIILGSAYFALYKYITPNEEWFACQQDIDCTDKTLCNGHAINKDFSSRATKFNKLLSPVYDNQCWARIYSARGSACHESVCLSDDDSGPEDWIKCDKTSDCVEVKTRCGGRNAVSRRFQFVAEKAYTKEVGHHKCPKFPKGDFYTYCESSQCKGAYR